MKDRFYTPEIKRLTSSQWLPERGERPEVRGGVKIGK